MRRVLTVLVLLLAAGASAFDSTSWLEKRQALRGEAARLKAAYDVCKASDGNPAEDVVVPVETFPDGTAQTVVRARHARYFHAKSLVWAQGVTILKYAKDGEVKVRLVADTCVIDRNTKSGWAEGKARLEYGETVFCGEGIYFSSPEGYVSVLEKADITSSDMKFGGVDR